MNIPELQVVLSYVLLAVLITIVACCIYILIHLMSKLGAPCHCARHRHLANKKHCMEDVI